MTRNPPMHHPTAFAGRFRTETVQPNHYRHALFRILLRNEKNDGRCTLNSQQSNYQYKMIAGLFLKFDNSKQLILVGLLCYEIENGQLADI